jgi:hypothetical protein
MSNKLSFLLIVCATVAHAETLTCTPLQHAYAPPLPAQMVVGTCDLSAPVTVRNVTLRPTNTGFVMQGLNVAVGPTPITTPGVYDLTVTVVYQK